MKLAKYSIGTGDRFAHQAKPQLQACMQALDAGVEVIPVWNKSNREHILIGSDPSETRRAADAAVAAVGWTLPYHLDADHINLETVGRFLEPCDFYTIDVADFIGRAAPAADIEGFLKQHRALTGSLELPGCSEPIVIDENLVRATAEKFLAAVQIAGQVYQAILRAKGEGNFIAEVSMDETDRAQSPAELLIILAAIANEGIPIQTIAPKFSGRFNKGVDYQGDVAQFEREFVLDVAAIAYAVKHFGLPANLKLSIHSGSDKFSIYPAIYRTMQKFNCGVHLKTAGTTWLEELIGLAEAGGEGLEAAKEIYSKAYAHRDELCAPYFSVIDIDAAELPSSRVVEGWTSEKYTAALRHRRGSREFNSSFRQLLHVGFKVAAQMGPRYLDLLQANEAIIGKNVTQNLYERHIGPVFLGHRI